jgi:hypothetical protein
MVKKPKYPSKKLTHEDKEILEQIIIKYAVKFYTLIEKYPNPKKYAEEVILKKMQSDATIATLYTITYAKNSPSDSVFRPGEINKRLANDIRKTIVQDYMTLKLEEREDHVKRFLHPRDLRERVLEKLENEGIFIHLEKKGIRHQEHKKTRPGKKGSSEEVRNDYGGRHYGGKSSAYKLTEEVEKLKNAMEKPGAIDFFYEKIIKSGLAHKLTKYKILAWLHAAKIDEKALHRMTGLGASLIQYNVKEEDTAKFKLLHSGLQLFEDNQLEQFADNIAKSAIEDRGYYNAFLFAIGLLRL